MAAIRDGLSMVFKGDQWVGRYRCLDRSWSTKRLPREIPRSKPAAARAWIVAWYDEYISQGGVTPDNLQVRPSSRVTLADIYDRWIAYRQSDPGTDPTYATALASQYRNWIAGDEISKLDIRTELNSLAIVSWIRRLGGAPSSRMTVASTLSVCLNDAILHGDQWGVDPVMPHPMIASPHVVRELDALRAKRRAQQVTTVFDPDEIERIFCERNSKVWDSRRVKYVLALSTGMRDRELQGLIWSDIKDVPLPHLWVIRQLVSGGAAPFVWLSDARKNPAAVKERAICKPPKRDSRRAIPLRPLAVELLSWWKKTGWQQFAGRPPTDQDPLFPSGFRNRHRPHGQFCTPTPSAILHDDLDRLGISRTYTSPVNGLTADHTSRSFRHTFASLLSQVGVDDGRIGDLLGHSAVSVTRVHYIEALLGARAEVVAKLRLPTSVILRAPHIVGVPSTSARVVRVLTSHF